MKDEILSAVQSNFAAIHDASNAFLSRLSLQGVDRDIILAAECAGLAMLESTGVDLSKHPPGMAIIGAIPDDKMRALNAFLGGYAMQNGLDIRTLNLGALSDTDKLYFRETSRYGKALAEVCTPQLPADLQAFVAATTAIKLVLAGKQLNLIDPPRGLALVAFHVIAGSKTVPFPADATS